MTEPLAIGIIGATGMAGREAVLHQQWLDRNGHDYAQLQAVTGSDRSAGRQLGSVFQEREQALADRYPFWEPRRCPDRYRDMEITTTDPKRLAEEVDAVISALPSGAARNIEPDLRERGVHVFSNASAFRWADDVPLMLPGVNPDAIRMTEEQETAGIQVNNPNCTTAGFVPLLQRLREHGHDIVRADVVTMQSISGKGDRVAEQEYADRIHGNAIDDWSTTDRRCNGEEQKSETEPQKILGTVQNRDHVLEQYDRLRNGASNAEDLAILPVAAQTNRIPSQYGHLESLTIELADAVTEDRFRDLLASGTQDQAMQRLPSTPEDQIVVQDTVEPADDVHRQDGMAVVAGRIRRTGERTYSLASLSHNLRLGATWTARHSLELYLQQEHGYFNR